jgi:hypothetical protein
MHYVWKIEGLQVENAYTHTWMAYHLLHNCRLPQSHLVARVAFRVEVPPLLVEVQRFLCAASGLVYFLLYHFGMEDSRPYDFCKPLLGVFPSQPSSADTQETQLHTTSLLGLWRKMF